MRESHERYESARAVAETLVESGAVKFDFEAGFVFASGLRSPMKIEAPVAFATPEAREALMLALAAYIAEHHLAHEVIEGVATGAILPATLLAELLGSGLGYVKKSGEVEGADVRGAHALVIEDVVTMGASSIPAAEALRDAGATVTDVLVIATYGFPEARRRFEAAGITLHALVTVPEIVEAAYARGMLTRGEYDEVIEWLEQHL